jgi:hypothetical protein
MVSPNPSTHPNCASDERGYQRIRFRQDTAENWLKNDPILASGEMGYVIGATDGPNLKVGDGWVKWSQLPWISSGSSGDSHSGAHIVSEVEPPPGESVGDLWIDPTVDPGVTAGSVDVLAAIKGQVIAPKAIDLDGPNTLYISQDFDGSVKLSIRSDSSKGTRLDNFFATEDWVRANSGGIYVGSTAPGNSNILWLNPAGGGGIAPTTEPPFVVSELAPVTTSSIWINPRG